MDRPPQQRFERPPQDRPQRQDRPAGERAGFMPRPPSTVPPPVRPGQGRPSGLYRGPALPQGGPPRPPLDAPPPATAEGTPPAEGTAPPPKVKKSGTKLTSQQKTGKAPLNTFSELAALFTTPAGAVPKDTAEFAGVAADFERKS